MGGAGALQPGAQGGLQVTPVAKGGHTRMPETRMIVTHFIVSDDVERSAALLHGGAWRHGGLRPGADQYRTRQHVHHHQRRRRPYRRQAHVSPSRRQETPTGSAASSISGSTDIHAVYAEWSARGAQFLTPPKQHAYEIRCYIRDPDGYIIEVGQTTDPQGDWWPADWPPITSGQSGGQRSVSAPLRGRLRDREGRRRPRVGADCSSPPILTGSKPAVRINRSTSSPARPSSVA